VICPPCRRQEHRDCPERLRQARLAREPLVVFGVILRNLAVSTGKLCDCQHLPGSMLAGSG
jgi:hypothetical protein